MSNYNLFNNGFTNKKKSDDIFTEINDLFRKIFKTKNSQDFIKFLRFIKRFRNRSPFNNALVFAQNPDCYYWATAKEWEKLGRYVKKEARPMVVLQPFSPIMFVYDYKDTKGKEITDEKMLYWFEEKERLHFDRKIIDRTIEYLEEKEGIRVIFLGKGNLTERHINLDTALGYVSSNKEIVLHPRYLEERYQTELYAVLVHEMAHYYLEHLKDREYLNRNINEIEAELTSWIVFTLFGIEKRSEEYLAFWLRDQKDLEKIDMSRILTVSWIIRNIGMGLVKLKEKKNEK